MAIDRGESMPGVRLSPLNETERQARAALVAKARRNVASCASDVDDCTELLSMLGLHPGQRDNEIAY